MAEKSPFDAEMLNNLDVKQLIHVFDLLPDLLFWIKDTQSRIIYANKYFIEHIGVQTLTQAYGLNDFDFAPKHIAQQFINDDKLVMQGKIVTDRLEMNILKSGEICWFTTTKRPLFNQQNQIIGSYGTSRHLEKTSLALSAMVELKTPVEFIRKHYMKDICIAELASLSHLSISALERRFKKHLAKTPKQFINEIRLENARRLLVETSLPIATIANEAGFADHSYFSRLFFKQFGELPSHFREGILSNQ